MTQIFALLTTSLLFGGMVLYAFGFAAFLFSALPPDLARRTIRAAFPHFYSFVFCMSLLAAALVWPQNTLSAVLLAIVALSTVPARQMLMPAINRATDAHQKSRFKWLHGASVAVTLIHIGLVGLVLVRFI